MPDRIYPKRPVPVYLASWRDWAGLTQEQLGGRIPTKDGLGVDKPTVSRWETAKPGKISSGALAAYAEAIGRGVTIRDLFNPAPPKGTPKPASLDAMASKLDEDTRARAIEFFATLGRRRAS